MKEDAIEDFKGVTDYLSTWNSTYGTAIDTAATTTGRLSEAFGELEKKLRDADAAYKDFTDKAANTTYDYAAAEQKFGTGVADYAQSVYDIEAEGGTPWMVVAGGSTKYKSENSNIAVTADGKVYKTDKPYSTGDIVNTDALTYLTELNPNIRDGKYATYLIHGNGEYAIKEGAVVQFNSRDLKSVIQTDDGKWYAVTDQGVFLWDDIVGSRTVESQVPETPVNKLNILQPDGTHVIRDAAEAYFTGQESLPNRPGNFGGNQVISDGSGNLYVLSAIEEFAKNGNYILVSPNTFDQKKDKNNKPYWTPKPGSEYYEYFDTGGYTGSWGPEGRLAVLHQKEIVLNAQDTENFLLATNVLRDIINKIQLTSLQQGINLMNNINTPNNLTPNIEQNITIHAEFPDATDHSEIELAFDNLVNKANQFAMSK